MKRVISSIFFLFFSVSFVPCVSIDSAVFFLLSNNQVVRSDLSFHPVTHAAVVSGVCTPEQSFTYRRHTRSCHMMIIFLFQAFFSINCQVAQFSSSIDLHTEQKKKSKEEGAQQ